MASSFLHDFKTSINDDIAVKPDNENEEDFEVENNPFAFAPGQLNKMFNPKSLSAFYKLGGLEGIEKGLRPGRTTGLSIDESRLDDYVTFEEATSGMPMCQDHPRLFGAGKKPGGSQCHVQQSEELDSSTTQSRPSLAVEVEHVHARLERVHAKCIAIELGHHRSLEKYSDPSPEQWDALQAIHRTLLNEYHDISIASSSLSPQLQNFRKLAYDHSLQSRSLRRFSDCLFPLLRREQDLESAQLWLEIRSLSSSLINILGKNDVLFSHEEMDFQNTIDQIEAILETLKLWFGRKYKNLNCTKDITEEQGLEELIFEFPDNIRHTCTTMPWTIFPALLVLWGVCWMFIIGSSHPEHERLSAANPLLSPVPAAYGPYGDFPDIDIGVALQESVVDDLINGGYLDQELWSEDALSFAQLAPQDPNFLATDFSLPSNTENMDLPEQGAAEILSTAVVHSPVLIACVSTEKGDAGDGADVNGYDHRTTGSDKGEKTKSRFVCPDCQQKFATSFTLSRHQTETHKLASSSGETLLCPNPGCKRSNGKPFKRRSHLERHLENCKHKQEGLGRRGNQSYPSSASASTPASHRQEGGSEQAVRVPGTRKRSRIEDDEESNDEFLLTEMVKKYKRMEKEIKEKQDDLEALGKAIQILEGSPRNS